MKIFSTRIHGYLDYLLGRYCSLLLLLLGVSIAVIGFETAMPITLGASIIIYGALTNYKLGAYRIIPALELS